MVDTLDVFSSAHSFREEDLRGKTVVMIDVLRASSTMVTALHHGARGIISVGDMDEAGKISQNLDSESFIMSGEKNGIKIDGYDLTNSPLRHTEDEVKDKTVILNTTNGTKAIDRADHAEKIFIGSFLNLDAVTEQLQKEENEVVLVCAGWRGRISFEDLLCAGNIVYELCAGSLPKTATDGTKVAFGLYEKFKDDVKGSIMSSNYAERLEGIVSKDDISYCCRLNVLQNLPILNEGIITTLDGTAK